MIIKNLSKLMKKTLSISKHAAPMIYLACKTERKKNLDEFL